MALKLIFKFERDNYSPEAMNNSNESIKQNLNRILDNNSITISHMYKPARNSVKVIFPTEKEIDKVIENEEEFKASNFEIKMSL